ncbi:MAG: hypothetical protein WCI48_07070 [Bacteroidota bacterium]
MKKYLIKPGFLFIIIGLLFFSCKKDFNTATPDQSSNNIKSFFDMKASSGFNWKTTQSISLELSSATRSYVLIKSTSSGITYYKALIQPSVTYKTVITIPAYEKDLTFDVNGTPSLIKIENNKIVYSF